MDTMNVRRAGMTGEEAIGLVKEVNGALVMDDIEGCTFDVIVHIPEEGWAKLKNEIYERNQREKNRLKERFSQEACVIPKAILESFDKSIEDADVINYLIRP